MLNLVTLQPRPGPRVVLVHGFGQRAEVWQSFSALIDPSAEVVAVDLPGHGNTDPKHDDTDLVESAELLVATAGPGVYVGYSLGARVVLTALAAHSSEVLAAVLVGAKAGFVETSVRESRRAADTALARQIERHGLEPFVDGWLAQSFNARLPAAQQHRDLRVSNRAEGLAASLRHAGSGTQPPLTPLQSAPSVVLVRGDDDLSTVTEDQERLLQLIPDSRLEIVEHCGHAVSFEQPQAFATIVNGLVQSVE